MSSLEEHAISSAVALLVKQKDNFHANAELWYSARTEVA